MGDNETVVSAFFRQLLEPACIFPQYSPIWPKSTPKWGNRY